MASDNKRSGEEGSRKEAYIGKEVDEEEEDVVDVGFHRFGSNFSRDWGSLFFRILSTDLPRSKGSRIFGIAFPPAQIGYVSVCHHHL